jgi:hypothetical protein
MQRLRPEYQGWQWRAVDGLNFAALPIVPQWWAGNFAGQETRLHLLAFSVVTHRMLPEVRVRVTLPFRPGFASWNISALLHHLKISRWNAINQTFATP